MGGGHCPETPAQRPLVPAREQRGHREMAGLTLRVLSLPASLGCVEEATFPAYQVQSLHQVGATQVLVHKGLGRSRRPEGQQSQQGQQAHPQGHGRGRRPGGLTGLSAKGHMPHPGPPPCAHPQML